MSLDIKVRPKQSVKPPVAAKPAVKPPRPPVGPPAQPPKQPGKPSGKKKWWVILLVVLLALIVAVVGYIIYTQPKDNKLTNTSPGLVSTFPSNNQPSQPATNTSAKPSQEITTTFSSELVETAQNISDFSRFDTELEKMGDFLNNVEVK